MTWWRPENAVYSTSATSASEINSPVSGSVTAPGECRASIPCPSILSMAWVMRGLRVITSENSMPAVTAAPMTALLPNAESPRAMILPVARRRGRW
ncbi:hypothetical protein Rwratislav_01827 [Rhodococcus wratislaviensis IFP 2016]|nr:hypothetical protein Rwratislav_01827 [Rhodococcus wratislaviensis IFP 2016]